MTQRFLLLALAGVLAACGSAPSTPSIPTTDLFKEGNAWQGGVPEGAEILSPEDFRKRVASGELVVSSTASIEAQKTAREKQYQVDKAFLQALPDKSPIIKTLLEEASVIAHFEGDRPVKAPGNQTVLLFGMATQLQNAAEAERRSQSVENVLADYTLTYALLPEELKSQAPTPASLAGKPLPELKAALLQQNTLLGANPGSLGSARLDMTGALQPQALNPGNGTDNNGVCSPQHLFKRYWFPLKNFISPIKNQASRGSCWAFTAIGALESRERVQNNNTVDLSEQFLMNKVKQDWDSSDYVDGYWSEKALETARIKNQLFPSEASWTYNGATSRPSVTSGDKNSYANSCDGYSGTCSDTAHQSRRSCTTVVFTFCGYAKVTFGGPGIASGPTVQVWKNGDHFDLNRYRLLLSRGHVLMASFPVYTGFMDSENLTQGAVRDYRTTRKDAKGNQVDGSYGGHAVQIVGFLSNQEMASNLGVPANIGGGGYFIIKNSWGCNAGDGGYYYAPADYVSRLFNSLSVLNFDARRSEAWNREQAAPGSAEAPRIEIKANPARFDLRVEGDLAQAFRVSHSVAKSVTLSVTSDKDGTLYSGSWNTDSGLFGPSLLRTFNSPGPRTLSLLARYGTSETRATLSVNVVNTAPSLTLQAAGTPRQGEDYAIAALIRDINEPDASKLCANTVWAVDAPHTLSNTTGCTQQVRFASTGTHQVRVSTQDSEGLSASQTLTLNVLPPPENPYPRIKSAGVYSREIITIGSLRMCGSKNMPSGSTIDLRDTGCSLVISQPAPRRYSAEVEVENPSGEVLTYSWKLHVSTPTGETVLYSANQPNATFPLYPYQNAIPVTNSCRVSVTVNAPDASRSKSLTVWTGKCTYYSTRIA